MKIQRSRNAQKGIFYGTISNSYSILMPFAMRTVLLYTLGVRYLGLNSLFGSVLQVLNLAELGVGSAMVYSMYRPIAEDDDETLCALMNLYRLYYRVIGLVILAAGLLLIPVLPGLISEELPEDVDLYVLYLLHLAATVLTYWLFAYKNSLLNAFQRRDVLSRIALLTNTLKYILQILVLLLIRNYYVYAVVIIAAQILNNIVTSLVVDRMFPNLRARNHLPREQVRKVNQRVRDLFTQKIGNVINSSSDNLVISAFLGLTQLAIFQNYYYVLSLPLALGNVVFESCRAGIGNSLETETRGKNLRDLRKLTLLMGWVSCVCCCGLLVLYQQFMTIWTGRDLLFPMPMVLLFVVYFYVVLFGRLLDTFKDAAGIWHKDRFRPLCAAVVNLCSNLIMVQFWGICGILLSSIISYVFVSLPWEIRNLFALVFEEGMLSYLRFAVRNVVITLLDCALCFFICSFLPDAGLLWFFVRGLVTLIAANAVLLICCGRTEEFNQCLPLLKGMLHLKK